CHFFSLVCSPALPFHRWHRRLFQRRTVVIPAVIRQRGRPPFLVSPPAGSTRQSAGCRSRALRPAATIPVLALERLCSTRGIPIPQLALERCCSTPPATATRPLALVRSLSTPPAGTTRPTVLTRSAKTPPAPPTQP